MTGLAAGEAAPLSAAATARYLMAARPGAQVDVVPRYDGPGLCARISCGGGHAMAIGPPGEVAAWVADHYQAPAAAGPRSRRRRPRAGEGSPGPSPAGQEG
jgi:hypothetical protein